MSFFLSAFAFLIWSIGIIFLYYTYNISQKSLLANNFIFFLVIYFIAILSIYGIYKCLILRKKSNITEWKISHIIFVFFLQLFLTCTLYTTVTSPQVGWFWIQKDAATLFVHIFSFLLYPVFLWFFWYTLGKSIVQKFQFSLPNAFLRLLSVAIWMIIFVFFLFLLGFFNILNFQTLLATFFALILASFSEWKNIFQEKWSISVNASPLSSKILSAEMAFFVLNFIISVAFISILRPMPIGWDDLGVYMNFPRIMANISGLLEGAGMYAWQLVTATGFLISDGVATQAFFVNQIGGILATIAIITTISLLLQKKNSHNFSEILSLPMILWIVYYVMPMTIFQQAKDMKLDPALMFVSVVAFMTLFYAIQSFFQNAKKEAFLLFFLAWLLVGFAFSIKFTSLILIISAFSYISYHILGFFGFIGFFAIFIALFTQWQLWSQLFVWMPDDTSKIVIFSIIISFFWFSFAWKSHRKNFVEYIKILSIFTLGIFFATLPWLGKNFLETKNSPSLAGLLHGKSSENSSVNGTFYADYSKIFSQEEFEKRNENHDYSLATNDGFSLNEDFARYFWYEKWLNNYLKLPANLTLQKTTKNEFTDITFIFLAFFPGAMFLLSQKTKNAQRKKIWLWGIWFFIFLGILTIYSVIFPQSATFLTDFLTKITLPSGYLVLLWLIFSFLWLVHYAIEDEKIRGIFVFSAIYGLIFWISAFGVVWYGVLLYFLLLVIIALWLDFYNTIHKNDTSKIQIFKKITMGIFFICIGAYLFFSAPLHSFRNLQTPNFSEYKFYSLSQNSSIFIDKSNYFSSVARLNLIDEKPLAESISTKLLQSKIGPFFQNDLPENDRNSLEKIHNWFLKNVQIAEQLGYLFQQNPEIITEKSQNYFEMTKKIIATADPIMNEMYTKVLLPEKNNQNSWNIYRIGTFFTYFINNNRSRFFEDNLLANFQKFFYDENPQIVADRMRKMGFSYILVDLNAATIDTKEANDSALKNNRTSLTARFENLLSTLKNEQFSLISTDNQCLEFALKQNQQNTLSDNDFFKIASTNYTRYESDENGNLRTISPKITTENCANAIFQATKSSALRDKILNHSSSFAVFSIN